MTMEGIFPDRLLKQRSVLRKPEFSLIFRRGAAD